MISVVTMPSVSNESFNADKLTQVTPQVTQSHQLHCSDIELQHMVKEEVQQQEGEDVSFNLGRRAVAAETESDCNITKSPLSAASHKLLASCWNWNNDFYF